MLKITNIETETEQRIVLAGKLTGPWIGELETAWKQFQARKGNLKTTVVLNEVTTIDQKAQGLLRTMMRTGAKLTATGLANRWLIENMNSDLIPKKRDRKVPLCRDVPPFLTRHSVRAWRLPS